MIINYPPSRRNKIVRNGKIVEKDEDERNFWYLKHLSEVDQESGVSIVAIRVAISSKLDQFIETRGKGSRRASKHGKMRNRLPSFYFRNSCNSVEFGMVTK